MSEKDQIRWNAKYADCRAVGNLQPDEWLRQNVPAGNPGRALDLACGLGQNAVWLAEQGWQVDGVDISPTGLRLAESHCRQRLAPPVNWIAADLDDFSPERSAYDLVIVFRFLDRNRLPDLICVALQPGGMVLYETFLSAQCERADNHLHNPVFALSPGELPQLFAGFRLIDYRESELQNRTVAQLAAQKPVSTASER